MIKSKFYLIRGDGIPIYVGFTNRSISKRFSEHKADKDFSGYSRVTIEKVDELDYEFTWDEKILYKNANEVSVREAQLVLEYGTQDSNYQKAIGGGTVWTYEKWFVRANKDNPKFTDMSGDEIESYIEAEREVSRYMVNFIGDMDDSVRVYMKSFINHMTSKEDLYMKHFISHMEEPVSRYMSDFIRGICDPVDQYMRNFINHMTSEESRYMSDFINGMKLEEDSYMKDFISHMKFEEDKYMSNFINDMVLEEDRYMKSFIKGMTKKGQI